VAATSPTSLQKYLRRHAYESKYISDSPAKCKSLKFIVHLELENFAEIKKEKFSMLH